MRDAHWSNMTEREGCLPERTDDLRGMVTFTTGSIVSPPGVFVVELVTGDAAGEDSWVVMLTTCGTSSVVDSAARGPPLLGAFRPEAR